MFGFLNRRRHETKAALTSLQREIQAADERSRLRLAEAHGQIAALLLVVSCILGRTTGVDRHEIISALKTAVGPGFGAKPEWIENNDQATEWFNNALNAFLQTVIETHKGR